MEHVGIMVPFLKVFLAWHALGLAILLTALYFVIKKERNKENN
jgi:hypothetical protein